MALQPPFQENPVRDDTGALSHAWTRHQQDIVDALGSVHDGVTDGSNAAAGQVGEYIEATFAGPVGLAGGGTAADVGSIGLTAGDWDVSGSVVFASSAGNLISVVAWVGTASAALADPGASAINTNVGTTRFSSGTRLLAGPVRFNVAAAVTVYLGASATFPSGTASAAGHLGARRVR